MWVMVVVGVRYSIAHMAKLDGEQDNSISQGTRMHTHHTVWAT